MMQIRFGVVPRFLCVATLFTTFLCKGNAVCRELDFYPLEYGARLDNHVIEERLVNSEDFCQALCYMENDCKSINFRHKKYVNGTHGCEINHSDKEQHPNDTQCSTDYSYRGTVNPYARSACKPGQGICQVGFNEEGYRCVCETGYTGNGTSCDDINECVNNTSCHPDARCVNTPGSFECRYKQDFFFPVSGTTAYVINRNMPDLTAVTVCLWMQSADNDNKGTPFSYAIKKQQNELLLFNYKNFAISVAGKDGKTKVSANDGNWHHICITWENTAGAWQLYKDGVRKSNGTGLNKGHKIRGGGALVLGQEQDSLEGGFAKEQSFVGNLFGVNVWDHVISPRNISRMSEACTPEEGNVISWFDFKKSHVKGNVTIIEPSSCKPWVQILRDDWDLNQNHEN